MSGSTVLAASVNLVDFGPQTSYEFIMPTVDNDGNLLSDGTTLSISFGAAITTLTLTGAFRTPQVTTATAGQVMNFRYSTNTASWWNA